MKKAQAEAIAKNIREMCEASAAIIQIDASDDCYTNHVMEARCRLTDCGSR